MTPEAVAELQKVDRYDFDIFNLRRTTDGNELITILPYILAKQGFFATCHLEYNHLMNFVRNLSAGYKSVTYHNQTHAADVCQTFNYFATDGGMKDVLKLDNLEFMSCLISATMHDYEHPGVNNAFLVMMND